MNGIIFSGIITVVFIFGFILGALIAIRDNQDDINDQWNQ